ncbi:CRISPR-associated endonuclease Cas2 [Nitratifractor sp.]
MYVFCMFDLPVSTKEERKKATKFKKDLLSLGFVRYQFSVYVAPVRGRHQAKDRISSIENLAPEGGSIRIVTITDRQFDRIVTIESSKYVKEKNPDVSISRFGVQGILEF